MSKERLGNVLDRYGIKIADCRVVWADDVLKETRFLTNSKHWAMFKKYKYIIFFGSIQCNYDDTPLFSNIYKVPTNSKDAKDSANWKTLKSFNKYKNKMVAVWPSRNFALDGKGAGNVFVAYTKSMDCCIEFGKFKCSFANRWSIPVALGIGVALGFAAFAIIYMKFLH